MLDINYKFMNTGQNVYILETNRDKISFYFLPYVQLILIII